MKKGKTTANPGYFEIILFNIFTFVILFARHLINKKIYTLILIIIFTINIYLIYIKEKYELNLPIRISIDDPFRFIYIASFMLIGCFFDFYYATYVSYGKLIIFAYALIISLILTIPFKFKLRKKSNLPKIVSIMMMCVILTPLLSQINTGLSFIHIKTVNAEIEYSERTTKFPPGKGRGNPTYNYFIYVDAESAPDINNKIKCNKSYYKSIAELNYKRGLLGVPFVELVENKY